MNGSLDVHNLDADAFRKLYPEQYFQRFLDDGIRPDGRTIGRSRATTIGVGTISSVEGSALVKQGDTTILAGVRTSLSRPLDSHPDCGALTINVELAPFSSADWRPGRAPELVSTVSERLHQILLGSSSREGISDPCSTSGSSGAFSLQQLCIAPGKACWSLLLDVYILNADGSVFDTVLLAAVAAISGTQLPAITTNSEGDVRRQHHKVSKQEGNREIKDSLLTATGPDQALVQQPSRPVVLERLPVSLTCGLYCSHVLVDPTSEEEAVSSSSVTVVLDQQGQLHGIFKPGGIKAASNVELLQCIESAKLRHKEASQLLQQSLQDWRDNAGNEDAAKMNY
ncbi:hypothetical protein CEUSTIGMA_g13399.t1 [Chlamydomonas eustigma]|uniref:Ribosomal RNA-processing protein 43 n=1 Tax=Chlamydomonas eustigma TaxID=1157962 RepID=A0A250XSJ0_9CHLO|nr:hypothetical protein CEUSTIGMA_g13399.t1 [Chlamydomonas eustigma]|eukprot:GAX85983.1 hypothetical protein CEUSTIGMA_g13399.t1 [Chlamydomonas eustigma]